MKNPKTYETTKELLVLSSLWNAENGDILLALLKDRIE